MDNMPGMDMGNSSPPPASMVHPQHSMMSYMHMTLFWGKNSIILFKNFPGANTGHYVLALVMVFAMAAGLEFLSHCCLIGNHWQRTAAELARAALHTIRMGLYYLLMLAFMSFNVGVLLVAVLGHAVVFLGFTNGWTSAFRSRSS